MNKRILINFPPDRPLAPCPAPPGIVDIMHNPMEGLKNKEPRRQ
ncbi:hypothetical protein [Desulforapulum autotrophicum]|nr:hypothetical protein [Desulforapulum autotrophicum]